MRCYYDKGYMTTCILKASPHLIFHVFDKVPKSTHMHNFTLSSLISY